MWCSIKFVLGVVVPAVLLAVLVLAFLHCVRLFLHKMGNYVGEVMWSYNDISVWINKALRYCKIPLTVPKYLVRNLS